MEFKIHFSVDNAAFGEDDAAAWTAETQRVLRAVADALDIDDANEGPIKDINGNLIGGYAERRTDGEIGSPLADALLDFGFVLQRVAGSSTAWGYTLPGGRQILLTDENGGHVFEAGWLLGVYEADGNNTDIIHYEFKRTEEAALFAAIRQMTGR
jgi:hypothetical protein